MSQSTPFRRTEPPSPAATDHLGSPDDAVTLELHWCSGCQQWTSNGCERCAPCDRCYATVPTASRVQTVTGARICQACQDTAFWRCPSCGHWNLNNTLCGNDCTSDYDDDPDDEDPDDEGDEDAGGLIHSYYYKPPPVFHGDGPLFLGLELEVATPTRRRADCARTAQTWLGSLGYLKQDESIGGGFEIVTHPMTYPWAVHCFPWPMLSDLHAAGCTATDKTGLHVHVSRAGFAGPCHTYRWMNFIHRNQAAVTALARRSGTTWAEFRDDDRRAVKDYAKGTWGLYRYRAINTTNVHTFELRVFASSLQIGQVQAALGFAAASVDYTRQLTVPAITRRDGWAWPAFVDWLTGHRQYGPLLAQVKALTCAC